jgi:hypothetical protein
MEKLSGRVFVAWEPHASFSREIDAVRSRWLQAAQILAAIKRTAPTGAKLLLLECVVGLVDGFDFSKDLDIEMLVMTTGRERTAEEWTRVLADGGWRLTRIAPTRGMSAVIEAEAA